MGVSGQVVPDLAVKATWNSVGEMPPPIDVRVLRCAATDGAPWMICGCGLCGPEALFDTIVAAGMLPGLMGATLAEMSKVTRH